MKAVEKSIDGKVWRAVINDEDVQSYLDEGYVISADDAPWRIEEAKYAKIAEIEEYDKSDNVNIFYLGEEAMWLPREDRIALRNGCEMAAQAGETIYTIWWNNKPYKMACEQFLFCLMKIEVYAVECFNVTAQHKADVMALETMADIEAYNIKDGYPDVLHF